MGAFHITRTPAGSRHGAEGRSAMSALLTVIVVLAIAVFAKSEIAVSSFHAVH
jgi:hypothetical protein